MNEIQKNALRREGYLAAARWFCEAHSVDFREDVVRRLALARFPNRRLRRIDDPYHHWHWWTFEDGRPRLWGRTGDDPTPYEVLADNVTVEGQGFASLTPARWAIWRDLEANPYEEPEAT